MTRQTRLTAQSTDASAVLAITPTMAGADAGPTGHVPLPHNPSQLGSGDALALAQAQTDIPRPKPAPKAPAPTRPVTQGRKKATTITASQDRIAIAPAATTEDTGPATPFVPGAPETPAPARQKRRSKDEIAAEKAAKEVEKQAKALEKQAKASALAREKAAKALEKETAKRKKVAGEKAWEEYEKSDHQAFTERGNQVLTQLPATVLGMDGEGEESFIDEINDVSICEDELDYFANQPSIPKSVSVIYLARKLHPSNHFP